MPSARRPPSGRPYPLVLLDARMPDTDGLALAAQIRKQPELSATRIILLTSGDRPGDLARSRELQIDAHLLKPVQQDELLETIYRVMSRTGRRRDARQPGLLAEGEQVPASAPAASAAAYSGGRGQRIQLAASGAVARASRPPTCGWPATAARHWTWRESEPSTCCSWTSTCRNWTASRLPEAIRERERTAGGHLPIIALTARSRKEDREQCLAAGMDDFLAKPVQAADLWAAIDRMHAHASVHRRTGPARPAGHLGRLRGRRRHPGEDLSGVSGPPAGRSKGRSGRLAGCGRTRLREAAHKLCGMVAAFSTAAGGVASQLEDYAAQGQVEEARPFVEQLESMARELMRLANGLSLETLNSACPGPQGRHAG